MGKAQYECKVIRTLVTTHSYGSPLFKDEILRRAAVPSHDLDEAKMAIESVRDYPFIVDSGNRGLKLVNSEFGALAMFLAEECDWSEFELKIRLKHFEGWDNLD